MKKPKQLEFKKVNGWGGKRSNSGRKSKTKTVNHMRRSRVDFKKPIMITLKLKPGLKGLRNPKLLKKFEDCAKEAKHHGLHVLHFSIESNHLHIAAEAKDNKALGNGMRSLGGRLGKAIRKFSNGKGPVFMGRYHLKVLKTPTETRNALAYVLLNQSKHKKAKPYADFFSSARYFGDWKALLGKAGAKFGVKGEALPDHLSEPRSWLGREGWRLAQIRSPA